LLLRKKKKKSRGIKGGDGRDVFTTLWSGKRVTEKRNSVRGKRHPKGERWPRRCWPREGDGLRTHHLVWGRMGCKLHKKEGLGRKKHLKNSKHITRTKKRRESVYQEKKIIQGEKRANTKGIRWYRGSSVPGEPKPLALRRQPPF